MKSFWLFLTLPLTMLIWKPFSFYTSCQNLIKKYWLFSEQKYIQFCFSELGKNKFQFLDSGSTFSISVMNLSISIFSTFSKNMFEKYSTTYFRRKYLTTYFWRKYSTKWRVEFPIQHWYDLKTPTNFPNPQKLFMSMLKTTF